MNAHRNKVPSKFIDDGENVVFVPGGSAPVDKLPAGIYSVLLSKEGPYLNRRYSTFNIASNLYGRIRRNFDTIKLHYNPNGAPVGVLATGIKGSGKSLICEMLCNFVVEHGLPALVVESSVDITSLRRVLDHVGPCALYFDEFGKIYETQHKSQAMLPLFSDRTLKGVLFLITANSSYEIGEFMFDRPGRFLFHVRHDGLKPELLREMLASEEFKELDTKLHPFLFKYLELNPTISFDVMSKVLALIVKMKTEQEVRECMEIINAPPLPIVGYELINIETKDETPKSFDGVRVVFDEHDDTIAVMGNLSLSQIFQYRILKFSLTKDFKNIGDGIFTAETDDYRITIKRTFTTPADNNMLMKLKNIKADGRAQDGNMLHGGGPFDPPYGHY